MVLSLGNAGMNFERVVLKPTELSRSKNIKSNEQILKTKYLFLNLLRLLNPSLVLDVGSMDGSDSMRFRRMLPKGRIVAFEANPYNYAKMQNNPRLADLNIEVRNMMVSSKVEKGTFYISQGAVEGKSGGNMGTSSSVKPVNAEEVAEVIEVDTTRIDDVILELTNPSGWVALWIDVEGAAYEVLSSVAASKQQVAILHVEVELEEFWIGQKLKKEVVSLANELGLVLLARSDNDKQQDLVFVHAKLVSDRSVMVSLAVILAKWLGPASSRILEKI